MRLHGIVATLFCLVLVAGCSNLNCTRLEPVLGGDVNLVTLGSEIADTLIGRAFPPLLPRQPNQPVLVTTFVDNNDLKVTSSFGRSLQNSVSGRFVDQGYAVRELKLRQDLLVRPGEGETILSRYLEQIDTRQPVQALVVGTYTLSNRVMYLSARLVRPSNRQVLASYEKRICLDANTLRMLGLEIQDYGEVPPPSRSILDELLYW